jgi:cystathionine beta-synthase
MPSNVHENVLSAIGNTPIVKLNKLVGPNDATVYVKLEFMNPGGAIKDRMAVHIVNKAEKDGRLKPGGTIVENTSGNTGFGLAMVAAVRGYKSIFTMPDKMSAEKINRLKGMGAQVVVTPTNVPADDPRSYYETAKRLVKRDAQLLLPEPVPHARQHRGALPLDGPGDLGPARRQVGLLRQRAWAPAAP